MRKSLLIAGVCLLISSISYSKSKTKSFEDITLEQIYTSPRFSASMVGGFRSMNDGKHYLSIITASAGKRALVRSSFETGNVVDTLVRLWELVPKDSTKAISFGPYSMSKNERSMLIATDIEFIYRHSTRETNFVLDMKSGSLTPLSIKGKQSFAEFSPDGKKVSFVRENNIFIKNLESGIETQVTFDGKANEIINGATDWVYEEEFSYTRAFYWSPDSKKLLFQKFDERLVPEYVMPIFNGLYPENEKYKYPKAGEKNSIVKAFIFNVENNQIFNVETGPEKDQYIPRMGWTKDENTLWFYRLNRHQNKLELMFASGNDGISRLVLLEESKTWIDIHDDLTFMDDKQHFVWSSDVSGYLHLYLYTIDGKKVNEITAGNWDMTSFYGVDQKNNWVYYQSAEVSPMDRDIYRVNLDGSSKIKLSTIKGNNKADFSSTYKYYMNTHSSANNPYTVTLHDASGKVIREIKNNKKLNEEMEKVGFSPVEFMTIKTSNGTELNAWMIKPQNMSKRKKYPVLMFVYGGPGSQTVNNSWGGSNLMWYQYLAQNGYIVVSVDNRGTGARGAAFKKSTYLNLGKLETEDQIEAAKYLGTLSYIDASRIGIFGWSYGGYMSTLCITKGNDVFKAAVAVAPVINWRYYDSIYTERYMRTPQENAEGYDSNSPSTYADRLKGKYLLIHGTADDNVHFQNSMMMVKELVKNNKQFDFAAYPDANHGIGGGLTRLQLFTKISNFVFQNI